MTAPKRGRAKISKGWQARDAALSALRIEGRSIKSVDLAGFHYRYEFFDDQRTRRIIDATRFGRQLPPEAEEGGARFNELKENLGTATLAIIKKDDLTRDERLAALRRVEQASTILLQLLKPPASNRAPINDMVQWIETEQQRTIAMKLGQKASSRFDGFLDKKFFLDAVETVQDLAVVAFSRIEATQRGGLYDPVDPELSAFIASLDEAFLLYFRHRPGVSTNPQTGLRGGPSVRFIIATAREMGFPLTAEQVKKLRTKSRQKSERDK